MVTTTQPRDGYGRQLYARHLARRRAWRAARGDADAFRHIMAAHQKTGFLYYYEEPKRRSPAAEIWLRCARRAAGLAAWAALSTAVIYVLGAIGYM